MEDLEHCITSMERLVQPGSIVQVNNQLLALSLLEIQSQSVTVSQLEEKGALQLAPDPLIQRGSGSRSWKNKNSKI
jgi:hypothetical protein